MNQRQVVPDAGNKVSEINLNDDELAFPLGGFESHLLKT